MVSIKCISIVLVVVFAVFSTTCLIIICCMKRSQATRHRAGAQLMLSKMIQGQTVSPQPIVYIGVHRPETMSDPEPNMADISVAEPDVLPITPSSVRVGPLTLGPVVSDRIKRLGRKRAPNHDGDYEVLPPPPPPPPHRR